MEEQQWISAITLHCLFAGGVSEGPESEQWELVSHTLSHNNRRTSRSYSQSGQRQREERKDLLPEDAPVGEKGLHHLIRERAAGENWSSRVVN